MRKSSNNNNNKVKEYKTTLGKREPHGAGDKYQVSLPPAAPDLQVESLVDDRKVCDGLTRVGMCPDCTGNTFIDRGLISNVFKIIVLSWFSIQGQLVAGNKTPFK